MFEERYILNNAITDNGDDQEHLLSNSMNNSQRIKGLGTDREKEGNTTARGVGTGILLVDGGRGPRQFMESVRSDIEVSSYTHVAHGETTFQKDSRSRESHDKNNNSYSKRSFNSTDMLSKSRSKER